MAAKLIFHDKYIYIDGAIREMVIWQLPNTNKERPHVLKYSLFYGYSNKCLVRYDNERGKGDHKHYLESEENYSFTTVEKLIKDFTADITNLRGESHD